MEVTEDKVQGVAVGVSELSNFRSMFFLSLQARVWNNFRDFKVWIIALSG